MTIKRDKRIDGEFDPPYVFNQNPTEEQKKAAQKIIEKYEKLAAANKKQIN